MVGEPIWPLARRRDAGVLVGTSRSGNTESGQMGQRAWIRAFESGH